MENLNKNNGLKFQKIENFNNYEFDFGQVVKFDSDVEDNQISLQIEIVATNLETKKEKVFAFQNGAYDSSYQPQQEKWDFYRDGSSENVVKSEGFSNMDDNDDNLIEYLNEYLNEYNYAEDYEIDNFINF